MSRLQKYVKDKTGKTIKEDNLTFIVNKYRDLNVPYRYIPNFVVHDIRKNGSRNDD